MHKTSARLLALLSLLQTPRDWSGEDLAERLGITSRTVRRDIDRLRELDYPITTVKGPAGGYRLEAGAHLPPLLFDDEQAVALAVALGTVASGDTSEADARVLMELGRTVHAREELRFDYTPGPGAAEGVRRVQPHHLVTWRHRWYLVAWDLDREDWRTFRADRVRPGTPTGPRFTPRDLPGGTVSTFVTGRFRGTDGTTTDWPCRGEVILHLPAAEVAPHAQDAIVEELGPRRCRLVLGSWSWTGLAAGIGRFDTEIEVVGPPQLAASFAELSARYARAGGAAGAGLSGARRTPVAGADFEPT
ncbi:YafY family protein [Streptomyces sp. NBC_00083]|uniref:helix-turn-helix transcriptional regulator n=1 Tax=Streptomyces sp. NBC_00083 TaxID=2975647 RepID=UPI00224DC2CF|nr:WYL domain-containing protein [Streptomyces sp. NBC_00083]MCX5386481.1 WYL domain-containing protein [Streptomyces sp. NBC_00083]